MNLCRHSKRIVLMSQEKLLGVWSIPSARTHVIKCTLCLSRSKRSKLSFKGSSMISWLSWVISKKMRSRIPQLLKVIDSHQSYNSMINYSRQMNWMIMLRKISSCQSIMGLWWLLRTLLSNHNSHTGQIMSTTLRLMIPWQVSIVSGSQKWHLRIYSE